MVSGECVELTRRKRNQMVSFVAVQACKICYSCSYAYVCSFHNGISPEVRLLQAIVADFDSMVHPSDDDVASQAAGQSFGVANFINIMILRLMCPMMLWALCLGCPQTNIIVAN